MLHAHYHNTACLEVYEYDNVALIFWQIFINAIVNCFPNTYFCDRRVRFYMTKVLFFGRKI